jgi:hypothetical protein
MYYQGAVAVLASRLGTIVLGHPLRVAITGIDAAGKTTLADELRDQLIRFGRPVVSISIDDYERPRTERYRRGVESAPGYYHDSFDFRALRDRVLVPLGPGGTLFYRRRLFDLAQDVGVDEPDDVAPGDAVALIDGVSSAAATFPHTGTTASSCTHRGQSRWKEPCAGIWLPARPRMHWSGAITDATLPPKICTRPRWTWSSGRMPSS